MKTRQLFSVDNPKASKAIDYGYLNAIHYLAPHTMGDAGNLCANASPGCIAICLGWFSGQAGMVSDHKPINNVRQSRIEKAQEIQKERAAYMHQLYKQILALVGGSVSRSVLYGKPLKLCVRLNGSSDLPWEAMKAHDGKSLPECFPDTQLVDYTKSFKRMMRFLNDPTWPANYHLVFSRSELNEAECVEVLKAGGKVSIVVDGIKPAFWKGFPVLDGDAHDLLHLQPRGHVLALSPKGRAAKADNTGFIIRSS